MNETKRCEVCDWPLKATMEEGCVEGNCSYRPHEGTEEYFRIRERRRYLAAKNGNPSLSWDGPLEPAEPSPEVAPMQDWNAGVKQTLDCLHEDGLITGRIRREVVRALWKPPAVAPALGRDCVPRPAAPAESQGVERAQPVECEACAHTLKTWWKGEGWIQQCTKCGLYFDPSETPSEPADDYRVTVDASYLKSLLRRPPAPVEGVERVTDNRTAETIRSKPYNSADELARSVEELLAENGRAETRIEVLEAALRGLLAHTEMKGDAAKLLAVGKARAALTAPSGENRGQK